MGRERRVSGQLVECNGGFGRGLLGGAPGLAFHLPGFGGKAAVLLFLKGGFAAALQDCGASSRRMRAKTANNGLNQP